MGRPENFWSDCHEDFLNGCDLRWNWEGTRLRVASRIEAVYGSTGPALGENGVMNSRIRGPYTGIVPRCNDLKDSLREFPC